MATGWSPPLTRSASRSSITVSALHRFERYSRLEAQASSIVPLNTPHGTLGARGLPGYLEAEDFIDPMTTTLVESDQSPRQISARCESRPMISVRMSSSVTGSVG